MCPVNDTEERMSLDRINMTVQELLTEMKDKSEVEIVDLVLKLREKLVRARCQHLPVKEETLRRVGLYIETIIDSLPEDLQAVLHHH